MRTGTAAHRWVRGARLPHEPVTGQCLPEQLVEQVFEVYRIRMARSTPRAGLWEGVFLIPASSAGTVRLTDFGRDDAGEVAAEMPQTRTRSGVGIAVLVAVLAIIAWLLRDFLTTVAKVWSTVVVDAAPAMSTVTLVMSVALTFMCGLIAFAVAGEVADASRTVRGVCAGAAALLAWSLIGVAVLGAHDNQWPWDAAPLSIAACGRTFIGPGSHYTVAEVRQMELQPVAEVSSLRGSLPIWATLDRQGNISCGTVIYVQVGQDELRGYALSGGL